MLVRLAKLMAGALWFFVCILLGVKLFFPAQAAADRASYEVDRATKGGIQLVLGDVAAWTLSGLAIDDLQVLRQPRARGRRSKRAEQPTTSCGPTALLAHWLTSREWTSAACPCSGRVAA